MLFAVTLTPVLWFQIVWKAFGIPVLCNLQGKIWRSFSRIIQDQEIIETVKARSGQKIFNKVKIKICLNQFSDLESID